MRSAGFRNAIKRTHVAANDDNGHFYYRPGIYIPATILIEQRQQLRYSTHRFFLNLARVSRRDTSREDNARLSVIDQQFPRRGTEKDPKVSLEGVRGWE